MSEKKKKRKLSLILTSIVVVAVIATVIVVVSGKMPGLSGAEEGQNKLPVEVTDEKGKAEIIEKQDASYERWLAAGMVTAVSMQYPDFEIQHIYLASEHDISPPVGSEPLSSAVFLDPLLPDLPLKYFLICQKSFRS